MAEITASMVKDLRERTGAGMMDCKNALVEAAGDVTKAVEVIQKKGLAKAVKAAGRIAADGMIVAAVTPDAQRGVLVEVNCQTDFVARGDEFKKFSKNVADHALAAEARGLEELHAHKVDGKTLREHAEELTVKSGEKHAIRRVEWFEVTGKGLIAAYIHHGARLGVLVQLETDKGNTEASRAFADEIALQVASMGAKFVRKSDAPKDVIDKQREIFVGQMKNEVEEAVKELDEWKRRMAEEGGEHSDAVKKQLETLEKKAATLKGRPEAANAKILEGKLAKWLNEMTLLEQASVKDSNKTIAQLVDEFAKANGKTEVTRIVRYELGEGIDKGPVKDFATEVAEMAAGAKH